MCKIKLKPTKSVHNDFTNKKIEHIPKTTNGQWVPYTKTTKYLNITLDTIILLKNSLEKEKRSVKY